jgi:anti-sigma-K factor RskA
VTFKAPFRTECGLQADIGIVVNANPEGTAMQATNRTRSILAALFIVMVAATLIGTTVWAPTKEAPAVSPVAKAGAQSPMAGTFTGEFENGAPVYRLPSVSITVSRTAELAKMAKEAQVARK